MDSCRTALRLQPDNTQAANNLGLALHALSRFAEAVAQFRAALEMRADFALARNNLGTSLRELGQFGEALQAYRSAVALDPNLALARSNLGQMLVDQGQAEEGLPHCEVVMEAKKKYNDGKGKSPEYLAMLKMAQGFFGKEALPTIEVDAHGLVSDAALARLPGNVSFFTDPGLIYGFNQKKETFALMKEIGIIGEIYDFDTARWDWKEIASLAGLEYVPPKMSPHIVAGEGVDLFPGDSLDEKTIVSFTIKFQTNQQEFSPTAYAEDFRRVIDQLQVFGNTVIVVRGHADPTQTLVDFLRAGMKTGIIKQTGSKVEGYRYFLADGTPLDLSKTAEVVAAIQKGDFSGSSPNPIETMQAALTLSQNRASQVRTAVIAFAQEKGLKLDVSQIQASGVGVKEPIISKPANKAQAEENMRVEFRLLRVPAEAVRTEDFDLLKEAK